VTCPAPEDILSLLGNVPLPATKRTALEEHRRKCERCRNFLRDTQMAERWLTDPALWDPNSRATREHLDSQDMLFAMSNAGGGVHLAECGACGDEAKIIHSTVSDLENNLIPETKVNLRSRLLALKANNTSSEATAVLTTGPRPATSLKRKSDKSTKVNRESMTDSKRRRKTGSNRRPSGRRRTHTGSRRRVNAQTNPMTGLLSGLAAAAALLLMIVIFASSGPGVIVDDDHTARNDPDKVTGPLVSDRPNEPKPKSLPENPPLNKDPVNPDPNPEVEPELLNPQPEFEPVIPEPGAVEPKKLPGTVETNPKKDPEVEAPKPKVEEKPDPKVDPSEAFARRHIADDGGHLMLTTSRIVGQLAMKKRGQDQWQAVKRGQDMVEMSPGDELSARGGPVFLTLSSGTELDLCMSEKTHVRIEGAKDGPVLGVGAGKIHCDFNRNFSPQVFVVKTPHSEFTSSGSTFGLEVKKGKTTANIYQGQVYYKGDQSQALHIGQAYAVKYKEAPKASGKAKSAKWGRAVLPRREIIYLADFERGTDQFTGDRFRQKNGNWVMKAKPVKGHKYWGLLSHLSQLRSFRVFEGIHVSFSCYMPKSAPFLIQMNNMTQADSSNQSGKYFAKNFGTVEGQRWHRMTVNIMDDLTTYFDPGHYPVKERDLFNKIWFYAGKPGDNFDVLIDNIEIYRKVYR
jgi:hypothetical protein